MFNMKCVISSFVVVSLISLFYSVKYATSIMCYDCNSAYDPRCGAEFDPFSLGIINCSLRDPPEHLPPMEATFCRTIKMEIYGKIRVVRQCGYVSDSPDAMKCQRVTSSDNLFVTYCACDTDLCNAAPTHDKQKIVLFTVLFIALLKL